jgi:hypothetical protein
MRFSVYRSGSFDNAKPGQTNVQFNNVTGSKAGCAARADLCESASSMRTVLAAGGYTRPSTTTSNTTGPLCVSARVIAGSNSSGRVIRSAVTPIDLAIAA